MPIPNPNKGESQSKFISRCAGNKTMNKDFPDQKQRLAVCHSQWRKRNNMKVNISLKNNFEIKKEVIGDIEYVVVPVIAMVEGVRNKLLYTAEEIAKNVDQWDGVPITIEHPQSRRGTSVGANSSPQLMEIQVGKMFNTTVIGGKLKGELWISVERVKEVSPESLSAIEEGRLEVSVGLFSAGDGTKGVWDGEEYNEKLFDFTPDHIALLPEGLGACSWADGCGVRDNRKGGDGDVKNKMKNQELDHDSLARKLRDKIDGGDAKIFTWIESIFDKFFIYSKDDQKNFLRQDYFIDKDDQVNLVGEPVKVKKEIKFIEFSKEEKSMSIVKERIDSLYTNDKDFMLPDDKESREFLSKLSEENFMKLEDCNCGEAKTLLTNAKKAEDENKELLKTNSDLKIELEKSKKEVKPEDKKEDDLKINKAELAKEILEGFTFNDLLAKASPEVKESIEDGLKVNEQKRNELIKSILSKKDCPYVEEELKGLKTNALEKLVSFGQVQVNYAGRGGGKTTTQYNEFDRHADGSGIPKMPTLEEYAASLK